MSAAVTETKVREPGTRRDDIVHVCRTWFDDPGHDCTPDGAGCQMFCGADEEGGSLFDTTPAGMVDCVVCASMEQAAFDARG